MAGNIKERQIDSLKCMLNLNSPFNISDGPQWKILIYDQLGRDIISPLLTVKDLRTLGVTLHLLINSSREQIPDVPAVYFVYPSKENILTICKDFEAGRYESYYLNFISPIPREYLEEIAQTALSENCVQQIAKVFDQYTNFICLEEDFITLGSSDIQSSYYALNRPKATEAHVENLVNCTVDGLFSIFATLGTVPIIRCPKGNASEMVATNLDTKFRDSLRDSRNSLFINHTSSRSLIGKDEQRSDSLNSPFHLSGNSQYSNLFQRPLLILLDRSMDLATPLHHELSYQSLVHDIFNIRLNRVRVNLDLMRSTTDSDKNEREVNKKPKIEEYDFSSTDRLWRDFKGAAFSDVAEAIREEVTILKDYEKRMGELKMSLGVSSDTDPVTASNTLTLLDDNTARLTSAVSSLPQLIERKRYLDVHTNIATCLANVIKERQLHLFAEEEDHLFNKNYLSSDHSLSDLIGNKSIGTEEDKLRLLLIAALSGNSNTLSSTSGGSNNPNNTNVSITSAISSSGTSIEFCLSDSELEKLKTVLQNNYPDLDLSSLNYVQRFRRTPKAGQFGDGAIDNVKNSGGRSMLNKIVSHGSAIILTGMRHLIGQKSYLPFTRIVSQLMENKSGSEVEDYRYFDPKLHRRHDPNVPRVKQAFNEAFVFVIGGGCYVEYQNLLDWVRSTSNTTGLNKSTSSTSNLSVNSATTGGAASTLSGANNTTNGNKETISSFSNTCNSKRVTYGCTDLVSASEFVAQLTQLGKEL